MSDQDPGPPQGQLADRSRTSGSLLTRASRSKIRQVPQVIRVGCNAGCGTPFPTTDVKLLPRTAAAVGLMQPHPLGRTSRICISSPYCPKETRGLLWSSIVLSSGMTFDDPRMAPVEMT